jgi:hypothetical protein
MLRDGRWPAMGPPFLPSLCDAGLNSVTKNVALEFGENGKHTCQGAATRGRHVERLGERDEPDTDGIEFLQGADQVE